MEEIFFHLLFFITISIQQLNANTIEDQLKIRLPNVLEPEKYELDIYTNGMINEPYFYGEVTITIKCVATTKQIIMNENFLNIERIQVWSVDKKELTSKPQVGKGYAESGHQITLKLDDALEKNSRYEVKIKYNKSSFQSQLFGYIFQPYEEPILHPNIHYLAYTRMKEIEARRVFPCLDQIGMKSTFSVRLRHPAGTKSISNAKKIADSVSIDEPRGWVMDAFADEESMSTFSVAFFVADYKSIGPAKISGDVPYIEIKLWAEKEDILKDLEIVMDVFSQIYTFFFNYFRTPHKLGKLNLIVIPKVHEAVQNSYGLIILRQKDFLDAFNESNKIVSLKYNAVSILCNAMSEQWIGHSVTMKAWNETWLHFGINAFLQKLCVRGFGLFDQWRNVNERLLIESFLILLRNEERGDFNPVVSLGKDSFFTAYSNSPTTYKKIHHVIRMLSFILESEKDVFRKSLENYVKEFEGGNTDVYKTWEIFDKTVRKEDTGLLPEDVTIKMIMDSWLTQKGHPLIDVSIDKRTHGIIVSQEPFNVPEVGKSEVSERPCWIIPLTYATKAKGDFQKVMVQKWLKCDGKPVRIENVDVDEWIIFNLKLHVPCRVNYEYSFWLSIRKLIQNPEEFSLVDPLTRLHLISDMFALAEAEKLSYQYLFNVLSYILEQEENYECWKVAISELNRIRLRWNGTELNSYFKQYVRNILRLVLNKKVLTGIILTFEKYLNSERKNDALKILMMLAACIFEAVECVQLSHKLLGEWALHTFGKNSELIPVELRESVFCLAIKNADMRERDFLFGLYQAENGPNLDNIILNALGCSGKKEILEKYLRWGTEFEENKMTADITLKVFESLSSNAVAYPTILDYLKNDYEKLEHFLDDEKTNITTEHFLIKVIDATKKQEPYQTLIALLPKNGRENKNASIMVGESKSKAEKIIDWLRRKEEEMIKYFISK